MPENALQFNHNQPVYSVSEVSQAIKRTVEDHFGVVRLRGEISGFKLHSSGHAYFSLKDDSAVIDAVCWRGNVGKLAFKPEDGLEIVGTGKVTTYPGRSKYQIVIEHMEPAGAGALMALLEKRRQQLQAEGLFEASRKKKLPYLPKVVGVVTSPTGAVIRDILHCIRERFPVHVLVWPVAVQGEGAAEQVAAAIAGFNALTSPELPADNSMVQGSGLGTPAGVHSSSSFIPRPDVIIVARGGGSIEDLWAFNEEIVVRAAAASQIPLISAVGHETDTTLIDFASDLRAPTPTAAAERAVPVRDELMQAVKQLEVRLSGAQMRGMERRRERLVALARALPRPAQLLQVATQRADDWSERLSAALPALLTKRQQQLMVAAAGVRVQPVLRALEQAGAKLKDHQERMARAAQRGIKQREEQLSMRVQLLESLNYQRVLERGFALVKTPQGHVVSRAQGAPEVMQIVFADGKLDVKKV